MKIDESKLISHEQLIRKYYPDLKDREKFYKEAEETRLELRKKYGLDIAEKVEKARIAEGLTQKEVAERINTKPASISRLERGQQNISVEYLAKVLDAIGRPYRITVEID
ncbi:MAG: helix-turn-helix transcriptional regulator [Candidatus Dojkabacteria bacterium]|nr:helix-turn-helix transcriptional regulator [Candidatus Dojkabacteria bacterium]MDQ7020986.1 helix-turn-helix transcriptional regulator [Candidatus Dojkabacteria bacterium]